MSKIICFDYEHIQIRKTLESEGKLILSETLIGGKPNNLIMISYTRGKEEL